MSGPRQHERDGIRAVPVDASGHLARRLARERPEDFRPELVLSSAGFDAHRAGYDEGLLEPGKALVEALGG